MFFLIEYDCPNQKLLKFDAYPRSDWERAQDDRLKLEIELLDKGIAHEVVIMEAESEAKLRKLHPRYFVTAEKISRGLSVALGASGRSKKAA